MHTALDVLGLQVAKHTPGPWWIEDGHQNRLIYAKDSDGDATVVAEVHWWVMDDAAESRANARLIAAAPDLLEALRGIAGEAAGQHADPLATLRVIESYARAALALATGEQG